MSEAILKTCATCTNLKSDPYAGTVLYSCKETGLMVPCSSDQQKAVFWRVPNQCPRPNSEVAKQESKIPQKHWEEIIFAHSNQE